MQSVANALETLFVIAQVVLFAGLVAGLFAALRNQTVRAIYKRNVLSYFSGVLGYLFIVVFVVAGAFLAFSPAFFTNNQANLDQLTDKFPILLLFLVPAITMSVWADERKLGTDELLFTLPATDLQVLIAKYLAVLTVYSAALFFSLAYWVVLGFIGGPDPWLILSTYFGYWLAGAALLGAGMLASVLTSSATVAFVLGVVFCAIPVFIDSLNMTGVFVAFAIFAAASGLWLLAIAFAESALEGVLTMFVPFYWIYYGVTRWRACGIPFTLLLIGMTGEVFAILNRALSPAYAAVGVGAILATIGGIWLLVVAFRESLKQGLLALLVPFYWVYYAATRWKSCSVGATLMFLGLICQGVAWFVHFSSPNATALSGLLQGLSVREQLRDFGLGILPFNGLWYFAGLAVFTLYLNLVFITRRHWAASQQTNMGLQFAIRAICVAALLISVNALAVIATYRVDLTSEGLYSMSLTTKDLIGNIAPERPITIQAFLSPEVPREYVATRKRLVGLLRQYDQLGGNKIDVRVVEVKPFSPEADEAKLFGIKPVPVQSERDGRRYEEDLYLGAVVTSGFDEVVIPFFGAGSLAEYELTRSIRTVSVDEAIKLWNAESGRLAMPLRGHTAGIWSVAYSPDGTRIAGAGKESSFKTWDAATGEIVLAFKGHTGEVTSVAYSHDGKKIASGSKDGTVKIWDASSGKELLTLKGHNDAVWGVAINPDGTLVASAGKDGTVKVWDVASGKETQNLKGHTGDVNSVAFSSDGKTIASGGRDATVKVWDATTGKELQNLTGHKSDVTCITFSPDGKKIASGSRDTTIKVWNTTSGQEVGTLEGSRNDVTCVAYSPDGSQIAGGSKDKTIRFWDAATGKETRSLQGHSRDVTAVAYSPDGNLIASGSKETRPTLGVVNTDAQIIGQSNSWRIVTELKQQYNVEEVSPDSPIDLRKYDVLLAALPSSLTAEQMKNLVDYVQSGRPTIIFDDPFPVIFMSNFGVANAPRQPKPRPGGMFSMGGPPPESKADDGRAISLLRALNIAWDNGEIVWDKFNPHPEFGDNVPPEYLFIMPRKEVPSAFSQDSEITKGLQEMLAAYSGRIRPRASDELKFEPLLRTGPRSGVLKWEQFTQDAFDPTRMQPTAGLRDPAEIEYFPDSDAHVLAAHITSKDKGKLNVIYVADIDLISDWFFQQREMVDVQRERRQSNLQLDNVTFVLNAVDLLAGDRSFLELRKRRPQSRTLTRVEEITARFVSERLAAEEAATREAKDQLQKEQERYDKEVKRIEEDTSIDARTKQILQNNLQAAIQRRLEVAKVNIDNAKKDKLDEVKSKSQQDIQNAESGIGYLAALIPPIPAILLGVFFFVWRVSTERRNITPDRRVRET